MQEQVQIFCGDWVDVLKTLPDQSVQTCCTSPPYWGLRDYGTKGQLGLEKTPEEYVAKLVAGFREVRRVLEQSGTLWLNLGDCYATGAGSARSPGGKCFGKQNPVINGNSFPQSQPNRMSLEGLKPKDLVGVPWRVAFALQADGWYLRSDIIWNKPNPMPESVTDRPTKAHEYIFLLSKGPKYFYDAAAIAEPISKSQIGRVRNDVFGGASWAERGQHSKGGTYEKGLNRSGEDGGTVALPWKCCEGQGANGQSGETLCQVPEVARPDERADHQGKNREQLSSDRPIGDREYNPFGLTRNKRTVWTVTTAPYQDAHFATFPPALITPCILAGSRPGDTILDCFGGSGTTGEVALEYGRKAIVIDINPKYVELIRQRTNVTPGLQLA